jgi:hypothetical protein
LAIRSLRNKRGKVGKWTLKRELTARIGLYFLSNKGMSLSSSFTSFLSVINLDIAVALTVGAGASSPAGAADA